MPEAIEIARRGDIICALLPQRVNRHGLVTGATGTGKTLTLQTIAERLSASGVPCFLADVKGDLTGISQMGSVGGTLAAVLTERGLDAPTSTSCPVSLWDVFGEQGHPLRATIPSKACSASCSKSPTIKVCSCSI